MRHDAFIEKCRDPAFSEIDELIRQHDVARVDRLLHAADRADGDHLRHADRFQCIDVGAVIDTAGIGPMPTSMAGKKCNPDTIQGADDQRIRWRAEWGADTHLANLFQPVNVVQSTAADDADRGLDSFFRCFHAVDSVSIVSDIGDSATGPRLCNSPINA